ncbi:MAG: sulfurtransferase complex subunit TusB [Gallionellaceae bacterium]
MLHIINKSPLSNNSLDSCLRVADAGDILLIEDAVYAATLGSAIEGKVLEAMNRFKVHVLLPDLEARGLSDRVIDGIATVDYGGFVDLVASNQNCQSWL